MLFSRRSKKILSVFFLINFIGQIFAPGIGYALTSGPTAPEATSFEPVDTTDIVNLQTGDFVYNIPLLEVPGPAGNYPLSLSYHAGIQLDQDASWVGLGFTLDPGAITRLVNGYPDDHRGVKDVSRVFWEGGETTTQSYGISYGIANAATVSAGLTFAQDTYRGKGVGASFGGSLGFGNPDAQIGPYGSLDVQINPYGGTTVSEGAGVGLKLGGLNVTSGVSFNSDNSFGLSSGISVANASLLGASISSSNSSPSLSVAGFTSGVNNSKAGNISSYSDGYSLDIPVYIGINVRIGESYRRYWIDETESVSTFGALNTPGNNPGFDIAFDSYDLLDTNLDLADFGDPEKVMGGTLPDYDQYSVSAQGVGGNIQPFFYQKQLFRQDKKTNNVVNTRSYPLVKNDNYIPVEFRFVNDFSNRYEYTPPDIQLSGSDISFDFNQDPTKNTAVTGDPQRLVPDSYAKNKLAGSKDVRWFTNAQILGSDNTRKPFEEGFINTNISDFSRSDDSQAGGFSITNSSGVTYHYALPVYSFNEYMRSQRYDEQGKLSYNELKKPEKYAYTWLLTSVTGPDFVDRNNNGLTDAGDYGYWVRFDYTKWLKDYQWRNPAEGFNKDLDGEFDFFSYGQKEIYYLDKITTESHVAVFEKSDRNDAREVLDLNAGGFGPIFIPGKNTCLQNCANLSGSDETDCEANCQGLPDADQLLPTRGQLKLDRIKLFNSSDYNSARTGLGNALRVIEFDYDYSLTKGTPNSSSPLDPATKLGKLTLVSLGFLGKGGVSLIPSTSFSYSKNPDYVKDKSDAWGFYKNDYAPISNPNLAKITSSTSSQDVDAWSLASISTPAGSTLNVHYESDYYDKAVLARQQILRTKDVTDLGNGQLKVTLWETGINLQDYLKINQDIQIDLSAAYDESQSDYVTYSKECDCHISDCTGLCGHVDDIATFLFSHDMTIKTIDPNNSFLILENADFYDYLKNGTKTFNGVAYINDNFVTYKETFGYIFQGNQAWPDYFPAGFISFPQTTTPGGGLRVKSLSLDNATSSSKTTYEYDNGITTYEPFRILPPLILPSYSAATGGAPQTTLKIKRALLNNYSKVLNNARQIPGPGVMYQNVKVTSSRVENGVETTLPNYSTYEFEVFNEGMIGITRDDVQSTATSGSYDNVPYTKIQTTKINLKDFTSRIGNVKSISLYNSDGTIVSKTTNQYLHDGLVTFEDNVNTYEPALSKDFSNQGMIAETFPRAKIVFYQAKEKIPYPTVEDKNYFFTSDERRLLGFVAKKNSYPTIQIGQTNTNYKTGITTETKNLGFDFYSGEITKTLTSDGYGNSLLSITEPAYTHYANMGPKGANSFKRNMLSQVSGSYSFKVDDSNQPIGLLSASFQTWSERVPVIGLTNPQINTWRKWSSFIWDGSQPLNNDGTYPMNDFKSFQVDPFNPVDISQNTGWQKTGEITLYDAFSRGLEAKDLNGNFVSTRLDPRQIHVIASTTNAAYEETAYSGAEFSSGNTFNEGDVNRGDGNPSNLQSHTGQFSLLVGYGNKGFNYVLQSGKADLSKKYRASVWAYFPGSSEVQSEMNNVQLYSSINGVETSSNATLQKSKSKNWYLMSLDIIPDGTNDVFIGVRNNSGRGVFFDDFRVHPIDASMVSYVYDPFSGELNYLLDANNVYSRYEYDAMGRLTRTSREQFNNDFGEGKESFKPDRVLGEVIYNYGKKN
jgi:hypothetical protein